MPAARPKIEKQCKFCGKTFYVQPHRKDTAKFCSRPCHNRHNGLKRADPIKICVTCGKPFRADRVSCSPECAVRKNGARVEKECENCGKAMSLLPSRSNRRFCSQECNHEWKRGRRYKTPIRRKCLMCDSTFLVRPSRATAKYCKKCDGRRNEDAYDRISGPDHEWFLGRVERRYGRNWNEQSRKARKRDGNRCAKCGKKHTFFRRMPVHHIIPRREFKTLKDLEDKGNKLSNLITLCPSCHAKAEQGLIPIQLGLL